MITAWEDYLKPRGAHAAYRECHKRCRSAFARQRTCIRAIVGDRRPEVIACLGAGALNDIPYRSFIDAGAIVHLVDWLPGIAEFGVAHSIIRGSADGLPLCVYCRGADAEAYCRSYRRPKASGREVCEAFTPNADDPETCAAFQKACLPHIHQKDVTGGYASAFGAGLAEALRGITSWRQAFKRAIALANRVEARSDTLDIPDHSVDLTISSMVISQFEHEPYTYFSRQVEALLGPPSAPEEARLLAAMEKLRQILLSNQIEGHCREIERITAGDGRIFLAFELFHGEAGGHRLRLIEPMHDALRLLARYFDFDFAGNPDPLVDTGFETGDDRSVVYHFLLAPKGA